jgi:peptidoglycan/xylan/chitin deacetylase (PgdA/CDA1 family)
MLTIVMYHYVRDLQRTQFPRIKSLLTEKFESQLEYISKSYSVCSFAEVIASTRGEGELPPNPCILTFDDGLKDHYETVFPRLAERRLPGAFFPCSRPTEEHCVLDVHKIQFILAATTNHGDLMEELLKLIDDCRSRYAIPPTEELRQRFAGSSRFDPPPVVFIKSVLQWALPPEVRSELTNALFLKYVSNDEAEFSASLYMQLPNIREMASYGMEIGGHGHNHEWLGKRPAAEQTYEIQKTVSFLADVLGHRPKDWVMCYPFGSYSSDTLNLLSKTECAYGLTTKVGLASLTHPLELARLDTNDLPSEGCASAMESFPHTSIATATIAGQ